MRHPNECRLYGFIDLSYILTEDAERATKLMIDGGVDLIQLRGKTRPIAEIVVLAARLHRITEPARVPLIVNDHAAVAAQIPVEGVHVGQEDDSVASARQKAGRPIIVGKSTHSLEQAGAAQAEGADYIGFGPILWTPTKPNYHPIGLDPIKVVQEQVQVPIFCIGGIKIDNLGEVLAAGAKRVAIVSGLLKASDIAKYARGCKAVLNPEG